MPRPKVLSAKMLVKIFVEFDFVTVSQRGSHLKLVRVTEKRQRQILTIPNHKELDRGTLLAIYRQSLRYISEEELRLYFYID
ncbi:type II toxin-antitoxin system HicA family toxin [Candidatus Microgenomates bacterium]|nr:type II toxin-antitoxin system HicA family toxin [Candidatus Microgenomates bacterium]